MSLALAIEHAIRARADWYHNRLIPQAPVRIELGLGQGSFGGPYMRFQDYLADYIVVSDAGYATELEVKISRGDWRIDSQKQKWGRLPPWISRFIYVVPMELVARGIPEWVNPMAGIWSVSVGGDRNDPTSYAHVLRNPRRIGRERVPQKVIDNWMRAFYYRYWRSRQHVRRTDNGRLVSDERIDEMKTRAAERADDLDEDIASN